MGLKDDLLALNSKNKHSILCFKKVSQLCKNAAKKGEYGI